MSETAAAEEPIKKKRRRRIATPPLNLTACTDDKDVYDSAVTNTYNALKSGQIEMPVSDIVRPASLEERSLSASSIDVEQTVNLVEQENEPVDTVVDAAEPVAPPEPEEPPSPPPPVYNHRPRRLGRGVKAAFDMLEHSRQQMFVSTVQDYHEEMSQQAADGVELVSEEPAADQIKLRVRMPSGIQKYEIKITDRIFTLREEIAKRESVLIERVSMFYKDRAIHTDDTVHSMGLTVADTVEVYIISEDAASSAAACEDNQSSSSGLLSIKVQGRGRRETMNISISPTDPLEKLMEKFAEAKGVDVSMLTFHFDGDELSPTETPTDLDMEDGDCVDVTGY